MAKLNINDFKRNGTYTLFVDESQTEPIAGVEILHTVVGQSRYKSAPVNTLVQIDTLEELYATFGKRDGKLERNGCYFILWAEILIREQGRPIYMLNLKNYEESQTVGKRAISGSLNSANSTTAVDIPITDIFDRSKGWQLDNTLIVKDDTDQILNISAFREQNLTVYIRPTKESVFGTMTLAEYKRRFTQLEIEDYLPTTTLVDDTFIEVFVFGRNFTKPSVATSPDMSPFMDSNGKILSDPKVNRDILTELSKVKESNFIGSFVGSYMPEIIDENGGSLFIENVINNNSKSTGLVANVNLDVVYEYIDWDEDEDGSRPLSIQLDNFGINGGSDVVNETKIGSITTPTINLSTGVDAKMKVVAINGTNINASSGVLSVDDGAGTYTASPLTISKGSDTVSPKVGKIHAWEITTIGNSAKEFYVSETMAKYIKVGMYAKSKLTTPTLNKYAYVTSVSRIGKIKHDAVDYDFYRITFNEDLQGITEAVNISVDGSFTDLVGVENTTLLTEDTTFINTFTLYNKPSSLEFSYEPFYLHGVSALNTQFVDGTSARQEQILDFVNSKSITNTLLDAETNRFTYIVDSFKTFPIAETKKQFSIIADKSKRMVALLSSPFWSDFRKSTNPYFKNSVNGIVDSKYIVSGGNKDLSYNRLFSFPNLDNGDYACGMFGTGIKYFDGTKTIIIPPNVFVALRYGDKIISPNTNRFDISAGLEDNMGVLNYDGIIGLEHEFTNDELDYLEPFGLNAIIKSDGQYVINGFASCRNGENSSSLSQLPNTELMMAIGERLQLLLDRNAKFKRNTVELRNKITLNATDILKEFAINTLESFTVICDTTNNTVETRKLGYLILDVEIVTADGIRIAINRMVIKKQ